MNLIPEGKVEIVPSPFLRSSRSSCLQWSSSRRIAASPATRGKLRDAGGPYRRSQWKKKVEFRSRQPRRTVALGHSRRVGSACGPCGHEFLEARSRWARKRHCTVIQWVNSALTSGLRRNFCPALGKQPGHKPPPLLLSGRCTTTAGSCRTSAGTQANEVVNQQVQSGASNWLIEARSANDILPADPGEMSKYLARFDLTEH